MNGHLSPVDDDLPPGNDDDIATYDELQKEGGPGLLGRLKQRRNEIRNREGKHLTLDIPGYGGELVARYRGLDWETLKRLGEKGEKIKHFKKELIVFADTMAMACIGLYARPNGTGKLVPLGRVLGIEPEEMTFADHKALGEHFGFTASSARDAVFGVFNDEINLTMHHNDWGEWNQSSETEGDDLFTGESESTRR